jgi:hypothetical protein
MQTWWCAVTAELALEPHRLHLLELACGAFDRAEQARGILVKTGLTYEGEHGPRARPEVAIERDARIAFARLVRELNLDDPIPQPPTWSATRGRPCGRGKAADPMPMPVELQVLIVTVN